MRAGADYARQSSTLSPVNAAKSATFAVTRTRYGDNPDLSNLEDGDLRHAVDFLSGYATVIEDWLHASAKDVLGGNFDRLDFLV